MKHKINTRILIVGAGPVGMLAAILLAEKGLDVQIIDKASGPATRSYACVLHARSLALLRRAGLLQRVLDAGRRIDTIHFFDGPTEIAKVSLSPASEEFPFVVSLPQGVLEKMLEQRLWAIGKKRILWNHRLQRLEPATLGAVATVECVGTTCEGYGVPTVELVVEKEFEMHASFVVGDDGPDSLVCSLLGIKRESFGSPVTFAICDTQDGPDPGNEARIMLDARGVGAFWPLPGNHCRWILPESDTPPKTNPPPKDRQPFIVQRSAREKAGLQERIAKLAPWFKHPISEIEWEEELSFRPVLAQRYGAEHAWLAGDAAHEGGPIGMQSMNAGLADAAALAEALEQIVSHNSPLAPLENYAVARRDEWLHLMALCQNAGGKHAQHAIECHLSRIPACLPALGYELDLLLHQLGIDTTELVAATAAKS